MRRIRFLLLPCTLVVVLAQASPGAAGPPANIRVTHDAGSVYLSADQLSGGTYTDTTLVRCGTDRRMQNEPTLAIDPRNTMVRTSGSNDYCTVPTNHDAWAGFYRSGNGGTTWVDTLLPGYLHDASAQGLASPVHQMALGGAIAAGDPVQAWDKDGNLFFMGNNFNRGFEDGRSGAFRDNTGDVWVATYAPANPSDSTTDGSRYVRTVILAANTFGLGSFNDKTGIQVDQTGSPFAGNVYAAWSDFHGGGCNEIVFSRSTDHGATFSAPMKISSVCNNQGPNIAIGPSGQVYVSWFATTGGTRALGGNFVEGAAFASSSDGGQTFSKASIVVQFNPFTSSAFSGNGARDCGDGLFACPTGFTFPRFDLAQPTIATDGGNIYMAFMTALPSGQGQTQFVKSSSGGAIWSTAAAVDPQASGHQFFPWITASSGRLSVVDYDSRHDVNYEPTRPPCNSPTGVGSACLAVRYSSSTNGGASWSHQELTTAFTNPNLEQFGGRLVPFFGDYITVSAVGGSIAAVWTDQRDAVLGGGGTGGVDGDDVLGDPAAGGTCLSSFRACFDTGGLDQNIYTANVTAGAG
ncbi:exo-alpha-sialidase [bacterium]|nr:MAG: exo-alpha-sialidase [bacterium]